MNDSSWPSARAFFRPTLLTLLTLILAPGTILAQGNLNPPGPPAPMMKSLDQLEARTPISSAPFSITAPGSYYLTTNLTVSSGNAINISTSGVTLDLNGFTIRSTAASATGFGILVNNGLSDITICNGHIRGGVTNNGSGVYSGSGFAYGITGSGLNPVNTLISRVSVSGCLFYGIHLGTDDTSMAESCTVRTVGGIGIRASTIKNCAAVDCGDTAIYGDQVSDCRGESVSGSGLSADVALNCYGSTSTSTGSFGLYANHAALNCFGIGGDTALSAFNASFCTASRSGGRAIEANTATGCVALSGTNLITHKYNMP